MDRAFLQLPEVAYLLELPPHTIYRLVRRGMLPTRVNRYNRSLQFGVSVVAARIADERGELLAAIARREVVVHQVNERNEGVRRWIAERTWPSEGTAFERDLRSDYAAWCALHGYTEAKRNSLTWSLERAGHPRRPWTEKPKANWRVHVGVALRSAGLPCADSRSTLFEFERAVSRGDQVLEDALRRREVVAIPTFGMAAAEYHGVDLFVESACMTGAGRAAPMSDLYATYTAWCSSKAIGAVPRRYFGELLADLGFRVAARMSDVPAALRSHARTSPQGRGEIRLGLAMRTT